MSMSRKAVVAVPIVAMALFGLSQLTSASGAGADATVPFAEQPYVLGNQIEEYAGFMMSGGPPIDGIPSIDRPRFISAVEARLDPGEMVIGFEHEGVARAYPHMILVQHEIVNDQVGGLNVAITYCPLTATAQGFKRGDTTLGVSGQLLNSNLVLFDRETRSFFSQIAATGLTGEHRGRTLDEVNLIWTTWERWHAAHPGTVPGLTILISPVNVLIGLVLAVLAGLNLTVTWMAFRQPKACGFNRSTGLLASIPALLAGSACCAPAIVLILGLQISSLFIIVFQVLIPTSIVLLVGTLAAILHRTDTRLLAASR